MKFESKFAFGDKVQNKNHPGSPVYFIDGVYFFPNRITPSYKCATFNYDGELRIVETEECELVSADEKPIGYFPKT